jgi:hypothetical protein
MFWEEYDISFALLSCTRYKQPALEGMKDINGLTLYSLIYFDALLHTELPSHEY